MSQNNAYFDINLTLLFISGCTNNIFNFKQFCAEGDCFAHKDLQDSTCTLSDLINFVLFSTKVILLKYYTEVTRISLRPVFHIIRKKVGLTILHVLKFFIE